MTTAILERRTQRLTETVTALPSKVDRDLGIIRNVVVLKQESRNGRTYTADAMAGAVSLYEGAAVNVDHPGRDEYDRDRRVSERFGELRNARFERGAIRADLHYLKSHPLAESVAEIAERMPSKLGLSHHASGATKTVDGRLVVESIEVVHSVDLVTDPAATSGLFEGRQQSEYQRMIDGKSLIEAIHAAPSNLTEAIKVRRTDGVEAENVDPLNTTLPPQEGLWDVFRSLVEDNDLTPKEIGKRVEELVTEWRAEKEKQPVAESYRLRGVTGRYISMLPAPCETLETFARLIR